MVNNIILLPLFFSILLIVSSSSLLYAQDENFNIPPGISNSSMTKLAQLEKLMNSSSMDNKSTDHVSEDEKVITWKIDNSKGNEFKIGYLSDWNVNKYVQIIQSPDGIEQFSYSISYPKYNNIDVLTRISVLDDLKSDDLHTVRALLSNLNFNTIIDGERTGSYSYGERDDRGYDVLLFQKFLTLHDGKLYKFVFKDVSYEIMQKMVGSIRWIN